MENKLFQGTHFAFQAVQVQCHVPCTDHVHVSIGVLVVLFEEEFANRKHVEKRCQGFRGSLNWPSIASTLYQVVRIRFGRFRP
jgi:hypothetical protein